MEEENNKNGSRYSIVHWFCTTIVFTLVILVLYQCHSTHIFTDSQNKITQEHVNHITKVDSLFFEMKKIILSSDSATIVNAPELLVQLHNDSAFFRREILLSQEEMNNLTELHLSRLDSSFDQMGVWFGVASVIFLVFGFFGIFKIEESKKESESAIREVKTEAKKSVGEVKTEAETVIKNIQDKADFIDEESKSISDIINNMTQQAETFYTKKNQEFNTVLQNRQQQLDLLYEQMESNVNALSEIKENLLSTIQSAEAVLKEIEQQKTKSKRNKK